MNTTVVWRDRTFGSAGQWIWITAGSVTLLPGMFLLIVFGGNGYAVPRSNVILAALFFLVPAVWGVFFISQVLNVFQRLSIDKQAISGRLYFGRQLIISLTDVSKISYYPLSWRIRKINLFDPTKPGVEIRTSNGTIYRINARTEALAEILDSLKAAASNYPQISCTL